MRVDLSRDYTFFVVEGGELREAVDSWRKVSEWARKKQKEFCDEFGAQGTCSTSWSISGIMWRKSDEARAPWKLAKRTTSDGEPYWVPDRKLKEGRAIAKRMAELPRAGASLLTELICKEHSIFSGRDHPNGGIALASCTLEIFCKIDVVGVPNVFEKEGCRPHTIPEGGRRLKTSEYFAMKEDHEFAELKKKRTSRKKAA